MVTLIEGFKVKTDFDNNIIVFIRPEVLISDLLQLPRNEHGQLHLVCERRRVPSNTGNNFTHMPPKLITLSKQETIDNKPTSSDDGETID